MCLAIPGKVTAREDCGGWVCGKADFGGVLRDVRLDFVPEVRIGDYVLVHVGVAISVIDEQEALRTLDLLREAGVELD